MKPKDGETFWYHECPETGYHRYVPIGKECPACLWAALSNTDKAKVRQSEYLNEIQGTE